MDAGLNQNESELGVLVLFVALQVLSDRDGLLDQHVQIFGKGRGEAGLLQDSENLGAGDRLHLGNAVGVSEDDANLFFLNGDGERKVGLLN